MTTPFPPPDFIRTETAVPGIDVWMPKPPDEEHKEVVEFRCPQCDASKAYSTDDGGLTCSYCGYYEAPETAVVGKTADEFEFTVETMTRVTQGWGEERKELACNRCDAHVTISTDMLTHTCPFCHSNQVVQVKAPQDDLRPRFLIPFTVDARSTQARTAKWLGSSWMLPAGLSRLAHGTDFTPIYIPAWTFDANTTAAWKAEVAYTKTTGYGKNKRTKTEWRWESGRVHLQFDDLMVNGTSKISQLLLNQVKRFNLHELVTYAPNYLAGIQAQAYDIQLDEAWTDARRYMRKQMKTACKEKATSQRMRNFSMKMDFSGESWRYILLPLYIAVYHYNHKPFQILVNGQSGEVAGQRPVAWQKLLAVLAGLLLPGFVVLLTSLYLLSVGSSYGNATFIMAGFMIIIAVVIDAVLMTQALKMDDV